MSEDHSPGDAGIRRRLLVDIERLCRLLSTVELKALRDQLRKLLADRR